jgi:hypothetical protein
MNRRLLFPVLLLSAAVLASCSLIDMLFGTKTGPLDGLEIRFSDSLERSLARTGTHTMPANASVAFSKIWFPTVSSYRNLVSKNLDNRREGIVPLTHAGLQGDLDSLSFYKACERDPDDPYVFDASIDVPFEPDLLPPFGSTFHSVLLETVFMQLDMEEGASATDHFKIRWYQQDSGDHRAGDVMVDAGNGWKYLLLKREIRFDYINVGREGVINSYERIDLASPATDIRLHLSDERRPAGMYYENSKYSGNQWLNAPYVEQFLGARAPSVLAAYESDRTKDYTGQTLVQIFRPTRDLPFLFDENSIGMGEEPTAAQSGDMSRHPCLVVGYGPQADPDNPYTIETFPEDKNEAQLYRIRLSYDIASHSNPNNGLGIEIPVDGVDPPAAAWSALAAWREMIDISMTSGGISIAFGWLDFDGEWQGEFSEDANR